MVRRRRHSWIGACYRLQPLLDVVRQAIVAVDLGHRGLVRIVVLGRLALAVLLLASPRSLLLLLLCLRRRHLTNAH